MEKEEENREMAEEEMEVKERGRRSSWRRWRRKRRWRRRVRRGGGGEGWKGDGRGGEPSHGVLDRLEPSVGEQHMVSALRVPGVAATIRLSGLRTFLFKQHYCLLWWLKDRLGLLQSLKELSCSQADLGDSIKIAGREDEIKVHKQPSATARHKKKKIPNLGKSEYFQNKLAKFQTSSLSEYIFWPGLWKKVHLVSEFFYQTWSLSARIGSRCCCPLRSTRSCGPGNYKLSLKIILAIMIFPLINPVTCLRLWW